MILSRAHLSFLVIALVVTPAVRADSQPLPRPELDARLHKALTDTINEGADAFNRGNQEGCYRLYQGSLQTLLPLLDHRPALKGAAEQKVRRAAMLRTAAERALALREAMDEVRDALGKDMAPAKSLYERLGGEAAIKAVVDDFVDRTAANPKVNITRKGTAAEWQATPENVAKLKKHVTQMVCAVTAGPQKYEGRSMKEVHARMRITNAEFDAVAADLKATLDKFKVPEKEQMELFKIIGTTRDDIVEVK